MLGAGGVEKGYLMSSKFPEIKAFDAASFVAFTGATASSTKGLQAIAAEMTDYSRKSFERNGVFFERLLNVKKIDEAFQLQSDFTKSAQDDFLAYANKIAEIYSSLTKEVFRPINVAPRAQPPVAAQTSIAPIAPQQN